jgi:hypothetical protein
MTNLVGDGQVDDHGLLDHDDQNRPSIPLSPTDRDNTTNKSKIRGNQDLWLLNLFFKGCALGV